MFVARQSTRRFLRSSSATCKRFSSTASTPSTDSTTSAASAASSASPASRISPRPQTIFSGIQPTGTPHLGNYLGALQSWVQSQSTQPSSTSLYYCIVDLHAITMPQQPAVLMQSRREMMASLLAMGLGPERCVIYEQSRVPEHTELAWILNTVAPVGYLNRMTQWKSKLNLDPNATNVTEVADTAGLNLGLFSYPVLQAADILLHKATHVPVGEDQLQHLELARHLARTFNKKFSKKSRVFPEPRPMLTPTKRVMSLRDPTKKMSKSDPNPASRILVTDEPAEIQKKLARAVTDSTLGITYDPTNRPGLATLITIHAGLTARSDDPESVAKEFASMGHHEYKAVVADCVAEYFGGFRGEYERLMKEPELLEEISRKGGEKARITARETMRKVKTVVGLA